MADFGQFNIRLSDLTEDSQLTTDEEDNDLLMEWGLERAQYKVITGREYI